MAATVTSPTPRAPGATQGDGDETEMVAFGKYRLHHRIARGGMGEVYRASLVGELGFEKALVIKTILPELAAQSRFIELFAAEAKTAVALSHGNIVPIYELGRAEETFYIVMGYVDGPSVSQLLETHRRRGHPPPIAVAVSIIRGVLSGLAYAHTEEPGRPAVVHRDVTPRNVMVDRSGQVRIVDFGIAAPAHAHAGIRAGSIGYVAPEQARAEAVDPRADVFSTGCLLYEMLTLDRAFPTEGVWTTPDLDKVPKAVREPLSLALSLDPAGRPPDAASLLYSLGEAITQHAATFSETDLAASLRTIYPDGRWGPPAEPDKSDVTRSTVVRPTTMTNATRPISISREFAKPLAGDVEDEDDDSLDSIRGSTTDPRRSLTGARIPEASTPRRAPLLLLGLLATAVLAWVLWPTPPEPAPAPDPAVALRSEQPKDLGSPAAATTPSDDDAGHGPATPPPDLPPAEPAALVLHVQPPEATVRIGTQEFEGGSPFTLPLPTHGVLEATVEHPGHEPQTVELRAGEPGERSISLEATSKGRGTLQVLAPGVSWAAVIVDGRRRGVTPIQKLELSAGTHRIVVRCLPDVCPGPESRVLLRRTVEIEPNATVRLTAK